MTTIYVPTLIESVEQAEKLPAGTIALHEWGHGTTAYTLTRGRWVLPSGAAVPHSEVVGKQALVPVEAEEEYTNRTTGGTRYPSTTKQRATECAERNPGVLLEVRLLTPWTDAP